MVDEEFGENTNGVKGEETDGGEFRTREISVIDDANLFHKAVDRSKKGRLYNLGLEGHILMATKLGSFVVALQPTHLQLTVGDVLVTPTVKITMRQILDKYDRQTTKC